MNFDLPDIVAAGLGICFGAFVAASIFLANLVATKFGRGNWLIDVALRLGCFGLLVLTFSEVLGSLFGSQLRQHALWFWASFALGLVFVPLMVALYNKSKKRSE